MLMHRYQPRTWTRWILRTSRALHVDPQTAECVLMLGAFILLFVLVAVTGVAVARLTFRPSWHVEVSLWT